jgi:hypothetical protein
VKRDGKEFPKRCNIFPGWSIRGPHYRISGLEPAISSICEPWHWRFHFNLRLVRIDWRNLKDGGTPGPRSGCPRIASETLDGNALPTCCCGADVGALSKAVELALSYDAKLDVAAS